MAINIYNHGLDLIYVVFIQTDSLIYSRIINDRLTFFRINSFVIFKDKLYGEIGSYFLQLLLKKTVQRLDISHIEWFIIFRFKIVRRERHEQR